jgi:glycosyltransferase involved in cell wall biosynthesis
MEFDHYREIKKLKNQKKILVSCIIPAWNEEKRIGNILKAIKDYEFFDEIIVVDDGSSDKTSGVVIKLKNFNKKLKLITLPENLGKAGAVLAGVKKSKGELLVLLDADIKGLSYKDIDKLMVYVLNGKYRMTILDRPSDRLSIASITDLSRLFGGERALWKKDFEQMDIGINDGYTIEIIINLYYVRKNLRVRTFYAKQLRSPYQFEKHGWIKGFKNYQKMFWSIYTKGGFTNNIRSMVNIEEDRLSILYKIKYKSKIIGWLLNPLIIILSLINAVSTYIYLNIQYFLLNKLVQIARNNIKKARKLKKTISNKINHRSKG